MYPIIKLSKREYDFLQGGTPPAKVNLWKPFAYDYTISPNTLIVLAIEGDNHSVLPVGHALLNNTGYLTLDEAWSTFTQGNCNQSKSEFLSAARDFPIICKTNRVFCTILSSVNLTKELPSLPGEPLSFVNPNVTALFSQSEFPYYLQSDDNNASQNIDSSEPFIPLDDDQTKVKVETQSVVREGQDEFRRSLFEAYDGRCCITGESMKEVLQAAHIQSYIDKRSHHVQNGLLLRSDFHLLYDSGLMTILPDYSIKVSSLVDSEYYQSFNGKKITLPVDPNKYPSMKALLLKSKEFRNQ